MGWSGAVIESAPEGPVFAVSGYAIPIAFCGERFHKVARDTFLIGHHGRHLADNDLTSAATLLGDRVAARPQASR
jgi:hypothetical protein